MRRRMRGKYRCLFGVRGTRVWAGIADLHAAKLRSLERATSVPRPPPSATSMTDMVLIAQVRSGNREAFRVLVVRYERPVFRFLGAFGLPRAHVEELAQETFVRAYRHLATYDESRAAFSSWLFTIAKNLAANEVARSSHRRERLVDVYEEGTEAWGEVAGADPHSALEGAERRSLVERALSRLPEVFRSAVALAYLQELSLEEIAVIEDCSVGTVKSRIFRAKQLLRVFLPKSEN